MARKRFKAPKRIKKIRARLGRLTNVASMRPKRADQWVSGWGRGVQLVLDDYVRRVARAAGGGAAFPGDESGRLGRKLYETNRRWAYRVVQDGFEIADLEVGGTEPTGKTAPVWGGKTEEPPVVIGGADKASVKERERKAERANEFLLRGDFERIDDWAATTSAGSTRTEAKRLAKIWDDAVASRDPKTGWAWTTTQISQAIRKRGLADSETRADMLARTGTVWSINEGAQQRYATAGVTAEEWLASLDDALCPFCATMHQKVVGVRDPFWLGDDEMAVERPDGKLVVLKTFGNVDHPPLHPRCRCTIVPVIRTERVAVTPPAAVRKAVKRPEPKKGKKPKRSIMGA